MLFEQVAFNAGQLSDSMKARSDFVKFNNGCAVAKNCLLKTQGPIFNRPGTQYIAPTKETSLPVRLIKFEFSELDAYALEFGNQYIRVYRQRGQLLDADAPYEIASPYGSSDLADLQFIQSGDIMRIVSANHPPHLLKRMGHTNWVIEQAPYTNGPYMPENTTPTQLRAEYKPELVDEWQDDTDYAEGDFRKVSGDPDRFFSCIFPHTSDTTVTHPIDGESNDLYWREFEAGDYIPAGAPVEITELTGTEANFNEGHIGSKWQISHERDDRTISENMGSTGTNETDAIPVFGAWTFRTGGSWVGFVRIQRSLDGAEWTTLQQYRSDTDYNVDTTGTETNDNAFYRIQFERESGTARVNFFNDQEFHDGEVEITEILDSEGEDAEKDGSAFDSYDDAVAHWKLDETSGTTAVDSKGDNDATLSGTTFDAITIAGKVGTAVRIDNSNTQEINGGAVFTNEQAMSFAMWIKPEYVRSGVHWFLSTTNTSTSGELILGWDSRNGGRMVYTLRGSGAYFYTPDSSSPVNEWVHVVYTRQQNTAAQWYINGEQVFNGTAAATIPHGDLLIGVNSANFYRGGIDNVIVYDRMLTSAEVSQLYFQTAPGAMGKVTVPLYKDAATTPTKRWAEALWSDYRGWPESVEGYEQRVIYGGNRQFPDHIVFSKTGDPDNLRIGSQDDAAMIRVLPGQNPVQWMKGRKGISLGTLNAAGRITGSGGDSEAITPESYLFEEHAFRGSAKVQPVLAGDSMLFVERGRKKVREFAYSLERDMYMAPDMTMLAEDIAGSGFKEIHFQSRPDSLVWGVTYDGYLAVMAYERQEQDVVGWTPIETDGIIESICIVPGAEEDEVYMVVQREADGQSVRYVEVMAPQGWDDLKDAWYVDSGLKWSGGSHRAITEISDGSGSGGDLEVTSPEHGFVDEDLVTLFGIVRIDGTSFDGVYEIADATGDTFKLKDIETNEYIDGSLLGEYDETATVIPVAKEIEGLGHLEGRTVAILADGVVHDQLEVESGEITLDDYYNTVIIGLPYESEFRSLPVSLLTQSGTSRGWLKKTKRIYLEFIRSLGAVYGAPDGDLRPIRFAPYTDAQDGTEPFTGLQELPLLAGFDKDAVVRVVQRKPLPFMLTRMIREVDLNAG